MRLSSPRALTPRRAGGWPLTLILGLALSGSGLAASACERHLEGHHQGGSATADEVQRGR